MYRGGIILKTPEQIEQMAAAGAIQARCAKMLRAKVRPASPLSELDVTAERFIASQGAQPSFLGYRGFPGSICASPNSMVVHGIPGPYELRRGDVISLDVGVTKDGWVADAAITVPVGEITPVARRLLGTTEAALHAAVEQALPGNHLGDISYAIERRVESDGFSIIRSLVGHGVGRDMHEDPQVPNYGERGRGPELEPGWCSRSSRWSTPAVPTCASARTTGPSTRPMGRSPPTLSSPSRSPRTGPGSSRPGTRADPALDGCGESAPRPVANIYRRPSGRFRVPARPIHGACGPSQQV